MEYTIKATPFPVVECQLNANEKMITESGSMVWMTPNMNMETSASGGLSRLFSGEKIFQNIYTAKGGPGMREMLVPTSALVVFFPRQDRCHRRGPGALDRSEVRFPCQ